MSRYEPKVITPWIEDDFITREARRAEFLETLQVMTNNMNLACMKRIAEENPDDLLATSVYEVIKSSYGDK